jgi:hypothetical protein
MDSVSLLIIAVIVMLIGLVGTVVPVLPGVPLVWLAAAGFGVLDEFRHLDALSFAVITLLGIAGVTAELWVTQAGARAGGASSTSALTGSCLGALAMLFFGLPVAILTALASVFGLELRRQGDPKAAARGSGGWLAGCLLSVVVQFSTAILMILIFLGSVLT